MGGRKRALEAEDDIGEGETSWSVGDEDDDFLHNAKQDRDEYLREVEADQKAEAEARKTNRAYRKSRTSKKKRVRPEEDRDQFEQLRCRLDLGSSQARSIQQASIKTLRQGRIGKGSIDEPLEKADRQDGLTSHNEDAEEEDEEGEEDGDVRSNFMAGKGVEASLHDSKSTYIDSESEEEVILVTAPPNRILSEDSVRVPVSVKAEAVEEGPSSEEEIIDLGSTWGGKTEANLPNISIQGHPLSSIIPVVTNTTYAKSLTVASGSLRTSLKEESNTLQTSAPMLHRKAGHQPSSSDEEIICLSALPRQSGQPIKRETSPQSLMVDASSMRPPDLEQAKESKRTEGAANTMYLEGGFRPAFSLSAQQHLAAGPLNLDESINVPAPINRFLRDYQRQGVHFFYDNYKRKQGGLLGDDMGLGKTIQVIAFLSAIMRKQGLESTDENRRIRSVRAGRASIRGQSANQVWPTCLIVCPNSVQTNWQNELDTWGYFEHDLLSDESLKDFQRGRLDILITSHQKAKLWIDRLNLQHWSVVFIDECHVLKNPHSGLTMALNSLQCSSRFGLTGTAIQNRLEEFWTLLDWCNPGEYGSLKHWQQVVAEPIRRGQSSMATVTELANARIIAEKLKTHLLPACFLRRTKELIKAQLPNKRDNIVFCPLTPLQITLYKKILDEPEVLLIRLAKDPCECGQVDEEGLPYMRCKCCYATDEKGRPWNVHMLKYIMLLQRCSNHLALVFPDPHDNIVLGDAASLADQMRKSRHDRQTEIVQQMFPTTWERKTNNKTNGFRAEYCGKWQVLRRLMQEWKGMGDKVLLFSMNLRLLDWLAYLVEMEGYNHLRLDGGTPQKKRQVLVNQFNHDPQIFLFLISTTAGGTGLNLTGANKVVVFDPHWNPAHDLQAMDRAYRFGQTRDVDVYRLIGKGSLEETIYDRQLYKQQMGRIGYDASEERRYFRPDDAKGFPRLFELNESSASVTKDIIQSCDLTEATFALHHFVKDAEVDQIKSDEFKADWDEFLVVQKELELAGPGADRRTAADSQDSIARVLQRSGIEYTHLNDDLLGGSRVESIISKQAKATMDAVLPAVKKVKREAASRRPREASTSVAPRIAAWPPLRSASRLSQP